MHYRKSSLLEVSLKVILENSANSTVLVLHPTDKAGLAGDLPGGRIDEQDLSCSFPDILHREIREEIGEDIVYHLETAPFATALHRVPTTVPGAEHGIVVLFLFYRARYQQGDVRLSDEHLEHEWINPREIELEKYFRSGLLDGMKSYCAL